MSMIDLADAKVSYEGKDLPAINLISKLQKQLLEAADQMAAMASTLRDLQAALLNSNTVDVKLTLSKEDFGRFRSLGGMNDSERIRKAVMALIHPEKKVISPGSVESLPVVTSGESRPAAPPVERKFDEHPIAAETAIKKTTTTKCPRCRSLIDLPEASNDQWSVEIQCKTCGAKYLVKSQTVNA